MKIFLCLLLFASIGSAKPQTRSCEDIGGIKGNPCQIKENQINGDCGALMDQDWDRVRFGPLKVIRI